jgi:hypothetical protein
MIEPIVTIHAGEPINFPCNVSDMIRGPIIDDVPQKMTTALLHLEIDYSTRFLFIDFTRHFKSANFRGFATSAGFQWLEGEIIKTN